MYLVISSCWARWPWVGEGVPFSLAPPDKPSGGQPGRHWEPPERGSDCPCSTPPRSPPCDCPLCPLSSGDSCERSISFPATTVCTHSWPPEFYREPRKIFKTFFIKRIKKHTQLLNSFSHFLSELLNFVYRGSSLIFFLISLNVASRGRSLCSSKRLL